VRPFAVHDDDVLQVRAIAEHRVERLHRDAPQRHGLDRFDQGLDVLLRLTGDLFRVAERGAELNALRERTR
jgi:hypothetical protein